MMINTVNIFVFFTFICTVIHAHWIIGKNDHELVDQDDDFWYVTSSHKTNRPTFPAYIRFFNKHTAKSEYEIECSSSTQIIYYNDDYRHQIIFRTIGHLWIEGDDYFITLDEGVLFSNSIENSTAYLNPKFWHFTVVRPLHGYALK